MSVNIVASPHQEDGAVFIRTVDDGLEKLLRTSLPLPEEIGDVTFEAPTATWSAQLSRITVSLFLYDVSRSTQTPRSTTHRVDAAGRPERRAPQPMIELAYLVSAWAGTPRDEHQLLGDLVSRFTTVEIVPPEYFPQPLSSSVLLAVADDPRTRLRDIWGGAGGQLKGSFTIAVTVAADAFDWRAEAPSVEAVSLLTAPMPREGVGQIRT